ncbi:MAG: hypothetical protein RIM33_06090 [Alphaproteobacteria bacterium]
MKSAVFAFCLGVMFAFAAGLPPRDAPAADGATFYYDMGNIHVQFEHETCGSRTLVVAYQIAFGAENQSSTITAYKPRIESSLFYALSDHLRETQNTGARSVQRIMLRAVEEALGDGIATDLLITEIQVLDA